jgi:hypothetical protein
LWDETSWSIIKVRLSDNGSTIGTLELPVAPRAGELFGFIDEGVPRWRLVQDVFHSGCP